MDGARVDYRLVSIDEMQRYGETGSLDEVLTHFGVKGMHWGVRRKSSTPKLPASEDAATANANRAKVKSSGIKALSNKELQEVITRMNLEEQYSKLAGTPGSQAAKFISKTLVNVGKQEATKAVSSFAAKQIAEALKK